MSRMSQEKDMGSYELEASRLQIYTNKHQAVYLYLARIL